MNNQPLSILVTGCNGQMGTALQCAAPNYSITVHFLSRAKLDITDPCAIDLALKYYRPVVLINAAAYTAVDQAEIEKNKAIEINYRGSKSIAIACQRYKIKLIHLSTDYVFNGEKKLPYVEEDEVNPINLYGESKWLGEEAIRLYCEAYVILRVSGIFSHYGNNFLKTMIALSQEKKELSIIYDQYTCPTYAIDIANTLIHIARRFIKTGTYHYCSSCPVSWYEFSEKIINEAKKYKKIMLERLHAITAEKYNAKAKRPTYSVLNCMKINNDYAIKQPNWQKAISVIIHELNKRQHV